MEELDFEELENKAEERNTKLAQPPKKMEENDLENNSQEVIESLLDLIDPKSSEWVIPVSLEGELDLSFIHNRQYDCIQRIVFQIPGKITALHNIPKNVVILYCNQQKLKTTKTFFIQPEQSQLEELYLQNNDLEDIASLESLQNLAILSIDNNPIQKIDRLPPSLEELYASNCYLDTLQFHSKQDNLYVLTINNNATPVTIPNLPKSVVDFQHENTETNILDHIETPKQTKIRNQENNVEKALQEYFELLAAYETQLFPRLNRKQGMKEGETKNQEKKLTCVNCGQYGGTYFAKKQNRYIATCGNKTRPCPLHIEIFTGNYQDVEQLVPQNRDEMLQLANEIISLRLKMVFELSPQAETVEKSKKAISTYEEIKKFQERIQRDTTRYNPTRRQKEQDDIADAALLLHEQETLLKDLMKRFQKGEIPMKDVIEYQVKVVQPLTDTLRNKKYKTMYVDARFNTNHSRLWQYTTDTILEEFNTAEPPRVLVYKTK